MESDLFKRYTDTEVQLLTWSNSIKLRDEIELNILFGGATAISRVRGEKHRQYNHYEPDDGKNVDLRSHVQQYSRQPLSRFLNGVGLIITYQKNLRPLQANKLKNHSELG